MGDWHAWKDRMGHGSWPMFAEIITKAAFTAGVALNRIPYGKAVLPVEPTAEMIEASGLSRRKARRVWIAMTRATQQQDKGEGDE